MLNFRMMMAAGDTRRLIQSTQAFEINFGSGDTSKTVTISSVDTSRSLVLLDGWHVGSNTDFRLCYSRLDLTNGTTVTATRNTSGVALTVRGVVIQFAPGKVSSIQTGTITLSSGTSSNTATISSVTTSRAVAIYMGNITSGTIISRAACTAELTNSTTITAARGDGSSSTATVGYTVIEFAAGVVDSMQTVSITIPADGSSTSTNATISSVSTGRSLLFYGGNSIAGSVAPNLAAPLIYLAGATTVTAQRNTASGTDAVTIKAMVAQFSASQGITVQRDRSTIALSNTAHDASITAVDTAKSAVSYLGFTTTETTNNEHQIFPTAKLLDTDTVRVERADATVDETVTVSWEVISG